MKTKIEFFDSHSHLADGAFEKDLGDVIKRAVNGGVTQILCVGDSEESSRKSISIARENNGIYAAVGIHPHNIEEYSPAIEENLRAWIDDPKVVAVGEIGLDYYRMNSSRNIQIGALQRQLDLAIESKKPVVLHCRKAYPELLETLSEKKGLRGVVHCFSGTLEDAQNLIELGFSIGITGVITFQKANDLREIVRKTSIEKILIETDSPYISPEPERGKRNEPGKILFIAKAIAEIKNLTLEDAARITTYNARYLLNLLSSQIPQIAYPIRRSLYLNITNRCSNNCTFCKRTSDFMVRGHYLRLEHEPEYDEVIEAVGNPHLYKEIVFCGYGEPTIRLNLLKKLASHFKREGLKVRLNTNGQGNLINERDILPELKDLIDVVSISLNAHNTELYNKLCRPQNPELAFQSILSFAQEAKRYIKEVILTVVTLPEVDINACRKIAEYLGAKFRVRDFMP